MSVKLEVEGYLGKNPYRQEIKGKSMVVLSIAIRRLQSRHADWITGTIWNEKLQEMVLQTFHAGDQVQVFGTMSKLGCYISKGKPNPSLDMFINSVGFVNHQEEKRDGNL
jgi:hypothetical protein